MDKLRKIIREIIQELLDEMTQTSDVAGYQTPYAFSGDDEFNRKEWEKKKAKLSGNWNVVNKISKNNDTLLEGRRGVYHHYRDNAEYNTKQKIGHSIRAIKENLINIEEIVDMNLRLKSESNIEFSDYWKRSKKSFSKIEERLNRISTKMKRFY